jgi:thymidylate synthase (FAD)
MMRSKTNKQAGTVQEAAELTEDNAERFRACLAALYAKQEKLYQDALKYGVPKELARVHLPVGRYSRMRASAKLRNWLEFLALRMAENAQWEIRAYANALATMMREVFPRTMALFDETRSPTA